MADKPIKITVDSTRQFLAVLRGAHHIKNAIEIYNEQTESVYYNCALDGLNKEMRKKVLAKASNLLQRNPPKNFNNNLRGRFDIRQDIFREIAV